MDLGRDNQSGFGTAKAAVQAPAGNNTFRLTVLDDSCTRKKAGTTTRITSGARPRQYCYCYQGVEGLPLRRVLLTEPVHSLFASIASPVILGFPALSRDQNSFSICCQVLLAIDDSPAAEISVKTGCLSVSELYDGAALIPDSACASPMTKMLTTDLISLSWSTLANMSLYLRISGDL